jgi:5-methylcytosine-specific restriction endonuclease McrA
MTITHNSDGLAGKVCHVCGEWKPLTKYSPRKEHGVPTGDGYQNACKKCRSAAELARYHANPEPIRAANRDRHAAKRELRLEAMRAYQAANRETILAQKRAHWAANREQINAERRARHAVNPELQRHADRTYYAANSEKRIAYGRAYRAANPDKVYTFNRSYYKRFPEKFFESVNRRRARKAQAPGSHTETEWEALKAEYGYTCLCCGRREPEIKLARDHIISLSEGGSNDIDNIQPLCKSCNSKKHTKRIDYRPSWEQRLSSSDTQDSS